MENSAELKALIRKNAALFWYTKDSEKENLPLPVVVEFFLNYAQQEDVQALFDIVGIQEVAKIFRAQLKVWRHRSNYFPIVQNYFSLYFSKYAS